MPMRFEAEEISDRELQTVFKKLERYLQKKNFRGVWIAARDFLSRLQANDNLPTQIAASVYDAYHVLHNLNFFLRSNRLPYRLYTSSSYGVKLPERRYRIIRIKKRESSAA